MSGIDIALVAARMRSFHLRGTARNAVSGEPAAGAQLRLAPKEWTATVIMPTATADPKGNFDIAGVVPGSYLLLGNMTMANPNAPAPAPGAPQPGPAGQRAIPASPPQGQPAAAGQPPAQIPLTGYQPIDVTSSSIENLQLDLVPGITLSGRITIEGAPVANPQRGLGVSLVREPDVVGLPASQLRGMVQPEGTFNIANVGPGEYRVYAPPLLAPFQWGVPNVPQALQNMYVKSMRIGSMNVLIDRVRVSGGTSPGELEVVLGTGGRLTGTVSDDRRAPMPNVMVALIPDGALRQRKDLYRTATTDVSGQFRMQGVPAGLYKAYAFEDEALDIWQNEDFMRPLESRGLAVEVRDGNSSTVDLQAVPRTRRP